MNDLSFDAVVVGGGIIGCTSAYFLARRGLNVALLEQGKIATGTTDNSFAWINATSKTTNSEYHRLNALGQAGYNALALEFGEAALGLNPCGALKIVESSEDNEYVATKEQFRRLQALNYPAAWLGNRELRSMEPHLKLSDWAEALFTMSDHCLEAPRFAGFMSSQLQSHGGALMENCTARELQADENGRVTGLMTDAGVLSARQILVAAGPQTPEVLSQITGYDGFAARFPLRRVPGLLVTTPDLTPHRLIRHVVYFASGVELHLLPDFNGGLKIGADDTDGMIEADSSVEDRRPAAEILLNRAKELLPGFAGVACLDDCQLGIGVRPFPEDGVSLAGRLPGSEGLYVIATHSGITLAPALGRLMADYIASGEQPPELTPFALERFPGFA